MSSVSTKLISHQHHLRTAVTSTLSPHLPSITPLLSSQTTTQSSSKFFHTSTIVQRPREDRDPKIKITLEQLRMAARGSGRRAPICHEQQEKVMNSLEAANYEVGCPVFLLDISFRILCFLHQLTSYTSSSPRHLSCVKISSNVWTELSHLQIHHRV
jgi:hypothetical protein